MNTKKRFWSFLIVLLILCGFCGAAYAFLGGLKWSGTFETTPAEVVWEYKVVTLPLNLSIEDGAFEEELNRLGHDGWELEEMIFSSPKSGAQALGGYYIMKRMSSR
ncbi:MAG: DUF4177 domain-containing protein [Candidatus Omnitrophica bacterium]|nr:DUF4177 domain-containing protein [Candidatus Omnitrophota bacterium]